MPSKWIKYSSALSGFVFRWLLHEVTGIWNIGKRTFCDSCSYLEHLALLHLGKRASMEPTAEELSERNTWKQKIFPYLCQEWFQQRTIHCTWERDHKACMKEKKSKKNASSEDDASTFVKCIFEKRIYKWSLLASFDSPLAALWGFNTFRTQLLKIKMLSSLY